MAKSNKTAISPTRAENYSEWYQQVINASDLAENLLAERAGITGYIYRSPHSGEEIAYTKDEVIRIYKPDPECSFRALGNLAPQALSYDTSLFIDQNLAERVLGGLQAEGVRT